VDKIAQHLGTTLVKSVPLIGQADATWETARAQK
jgi:DNA mismatch repair protein MutH